MTTPAEDALRTEIVTLRKANDALREACIAGKGTLEDLRDRFTGPDTKHLSAYDNYDSFYQEMVNEAIEEMHEALQ